MNEIMTQRDANNLASHRQFVQRKQQAEQDAFSANVKQAAATGAKLSQIYDYDQKKLIKLKKPFGVDEHGNVCAADLAQFDPEEQSTLDDIRRSLFHDPTVITAPSDHGRSQLAPGNPFG